MITKDNVITLAYKGLAALILSIFRKKDKIKALFDCLCKTHESLSSANGRVKIKEEKLILDENITSLSDMVNFQLNI